MSTIVQLGIPAGSFALAGSMDAVSNVEVQAERVVAHERDRVLPFCWASGPEDELDAFEAALDADPTVENDERLTSLADGRFYRMEWTDRVDVLVHSMTEHGAVILKARGFDDRWHLRILFPDRDAVSRTHEFCHERRLDVDVEQIHELEHDEQGSHFGLTPEQYDAVTTAFEQGYYDVPRETAARDLAETLDISHQALSERLRRGHENLVANALTLDGDEERVERPGAVPE